MAEAFLESSSVVRASGTVAERLRGARARRFVGREAELELFASALEGAEPSFSVLFVEGPGGVGKTALLHALAEVAGDAELDPVRLDLRALEPSPAGFAAALGAALGLAEGAAAVAALTARRRVVLLLDTFELATGLEDWLREWFVPALPAGSVVVITGRTAPSAAWRRDPGWRELLRVISLRNLLPGEARALLASVGVPEESQERWLALTHGHPLALWLLIERCAQPGGATEPPPALYAAPDVVRSLVEGFASRNDAHLQGFRPPTGQTDAALKTRERILTMEVLYQLS